MIYVIPSLLLFHRKDYFDVSSWWVWYLPGNSGNSITLISSLLSAILCEWLWFPQIKWLTVFTSNYTPVCSSLNPQNCYLINDLIPCFFDLDTLTKQSHGELSKTESNSSGIQESESTIWMTQVPIFKALLFRILIKRKGHWNFVSEWCWRGLMCLLQYYQVVYKTIIQNKISLKCRSWANTIPPAAIKVVFFILQNQNREDDIY